MYKTQTISWYFILYLKMDWKPSEFYFLLDKLALTLFFWQGAGILEIIEIDL